MHYLSLFRWFNLCESFSYFFVSLVLWHFFYCFLTLRPTSDIFFSHNFEIKRFCNKKLKIHFSSKKFFLCELKIFIFGQLCLLKPSLKYFKMPLQYFEGIFYYQNVFLSFYHNIVCKNIVCWRGLYSASHCITL